LQQVLYQLLLALVVLAVTLREAIFQDRVITVFLQASTVFSMDPAVVVALIQRFW
jgi:hypothetical protein